ncbi:TPA: hypothetical protein PIT94_005042 [Klebsiella quasipneumoniae subsp. similipneumoniae]|jgi:predicted permease|uniref:Uncharacterized protein n=2 Tax=Escherichia coli TaxID=562 RepID=A0A6L7A1Q4_ECOLX|nr:MULTISPECIES: hypothetical protein [Enterobacteriaceae]HDS8944313.1 hypothetical protein [Klebsiella pneumoniae subsp. ozaenae]EER7031281.1 hypothetical protein [Escherichia coli]EIG2474404.1 hypothetical protein [Escherichia coli]EIG2543151.1 hypothetical protein [Escherichia coli]EIG2553527.1 hypothetical protein [Escherichia coli]
MGFIGNLFSIFTGRTTDYDKLTLIGFGDWLEAYSSSNSLSQSSMATALMVQGVNLLVQNMGNEYSVLYSFIRNKKVSSKKVFDDFFIPFIVHCKQNDNVGEFDYRTLMGMPARATMAYMIATIYDSDPQLLFDIE